MINLLPITYYLNNVLAKQEHCANMSVGMKIRHLVISLLPALAVADQATTVPDDEPWHEPLPEELLQPQKGNAALPATAQPVVSYRAPADEEQTWLKLLYVRDSETWPDVFRRMASASRENGMQMCHGYALWLKGQPLLYLRYDDDLSLSGIHADGHAYGVLFVEVNSYGIRACPMEGYDLTGKNGGVCWQNASTRLWSWAEAEKFWAELPRLLKADSRTRASSAQDSAVKREVATKGQRMVVFWAPAGYPAKFWWPAFARLHAAVGPHRFSLVAAEGLKLWADVVVPGAQPAATPATPPPAGTAGAAATPAAPTPATAAPSNHAAAGQAPAGAPPSATAAPSTPSVAQPPVPDKLQPGSGSPRDVAPAASVRPWELVAAAKRKAEAAAASTPAATPASPATPSTPEAAPATPAQPPSTPARTLDSLPSIPQ